MRSLALFLTLSRAGLGVSTGDDTPPVPVPPEVVARDSEGRVTVRAVRLPGPLEVDGLLEDRAYSVIPAIEGFIQQEPREGDPATEKTEAWVFFDDKGLYVSARCWDSHPERMVANEMRRDNFNIFFNENFGVILDTFHDRRNGFVFQTNPLGGIYDGYVTDERDSNSDWSTVWQVKTGRFRSGWTVEMAIPFKSLRYRSPDDGDVQGGQVWGINFRRIVRWKNETSYLTRIPAAFSFRGLNRVSSAATLVGVEPPQALNLEVKPYVTAGSHTDREADPPYTNDLDADAGFDVKYGLTRSLTFDFTYNTDFAQVEADEEQVNLTRFDLYFPEKREFFLEGQGIFTFGGPQPRWWEGQSPAPVVFFSRRIGLAEERVVPILAGGRLTGRAGNFSVGALDIQTRELAEAEALATNFSVLRVKRDVLRRSTIGLIATRRSPALSGEGVNQVYGFDTSLGFYENVAVNGYYARSTTPGREGDEASYRGRFEYAGDRYGFEYDHLVVGENFNPEIGFLRREAFRRDFGHFRFSPRPRSIAAVRKFSFEGRLDYVTDRQGWLSTREVGGNFRTEFQSGDQFDVFYLRSYEFLVEPFEISDGVVLPTGPYDFQAFGFNYEMGPQRKLSGLLGFDGGSFYSGRRFSLNYTGRVELSARLTVEPRVSLNWVNLHEGRFVAQLLGGRLNFGITPRVFLGALIQYNSSDNSLGTNLRFRWEYQPGSDLYVVYSDGRDTLGPGFPFALSRSLVVKFTRLFRF